MDTPRTTWKSRSKAAMLELGPYAAAAILVPGGTLVAGLVWLYRHRKTPATRS